jgi:hypothetical protein
MGKTHRGKGIKDLFAHGRGVCPACGTGGIKVLYEHDAGGQKVKVCKPCKAAIKHGKKSVPAPAAAPAAAE